MFNHNPHGGLASTFRSCLLLVVWPDESPEGLPHPTWGPPQQLLHHLLLQHLSLPLPGVTESSLAPWLLLQEGDFQVWSAPAATLWPTSGGSWGGEPTLAAGPKDLPKTTY